MPRKGQWTSSVAKVSAAEETARAESAIQPIATIEISIYALKEGQSEMSLRVSPNGAFAAYQEDSKIASELYRVVTREFRNGLRMLAE